MQTFKIGDWLQVIAGHERPIGSLFKVESCLTRYRAADVKLWQPQPDELVILKDKNGIISVIKYNGEPNVYPFIGEITWLHKKD